MNKEIQSFPLYANEVVLTEGASATLASKAGFQYNRISDLRYGTTAVLRLPEGFDIGLRPIENWEGTASVKGIAKIDPPKLGTFGQWHWSMATEQDLCNRFNKLFADMRAQLKKSPEQLPDFPCSRSAGSLGAEWKSLNGGLSTFLPRTRYFFTAGIAYLGVEITEAVYHSFEIPKGATASDREAIRSLIKRYIMIAAGKHMPQEYIDGQNGNSVMLRLDTAKADVNRQVAVAEEDFSLGVFPIEIKKSTTVSLVDPFKGKSNAKFVVLGDSFATTHFFTGSGAVNGLRAAALFGALLRSKESTYDWLSFAQKVEENTQSMHARVMEGLGNAPLDGPFNSRLDRSRESSAAGNPFDIIE